MNIAAVLRSWIKVNAAFVRESLSGAKAGRTRDFRQLYVDVHAQARPVFVLSTGRCGTEYLTRLLASDRSAGVYHEPSPELIFHSRLAYESYPEKNAELTAAFDAARYEMIAREYLAGRIFIETNNRVSFFAHQIRDLYPRSVFIHLVRHPGAFVRSGMSRNQPWYSGKNRHDEGRIVPRDGCDWDAWPSIRKIGWLWSETNTFIEQFKTTVDAARVLTVRAEDLFAGSGSIRKTLSFAGVSGADGKPGSSRPVNRSSGYRMRPYAEWEEADKNLLQKAVPKDLARKYGYGDVHD